ncbi:hypothetical protein FA13DRAFT_1395486 [Coprinellus micaceus]|uniref:Uncharacterized protein n=1 Tax=Coprinellus micaceus TaxID=71717 RepID=A0A4Y7SRN2_COPMI|nr:hypothetical protein FA13DRAFT_1395486 [Coprinellus micaceus]
MKLLGEWPEQVDENLAATDALLSLMTAEKLPKEPLQASDYELAKACIMGVQWSMQVSGQNAKRFNKVHQDKTSGMLVTGLEGILLWMDIWARGFRDFAEENEEFLLSSHVLVAHIAATCSQLSCFSRTLGSAMRVLPLAASVVAGLWMWIDPKTRLPFFMVDLRVDGYDGGCASIDAMVVYVHDSKEASMAFLQALAAPSAAFDGAAADYFVRLEITRLRMMREACKTSKRSIHFIGHSLTWLTEAYTDFAKAEEPHLVSALHTQGFLRELLSTIRCISALL